MGSVMKTACLPCSFSSDFVIKAADCFFFIFYCTLSPSASSSLHLLSSFLFFSIFSPLPSCLPSCLSLWLFLFSLPLAICAYMFVKIYWSPVVPPHSHACSVSLSHSSVHKTRSLWPDIKEKGGKEKRDRFSSVP